VPGKAACPGQLIHFNRGFTREQMIQRLRQAQDRLVREAWERRNPRSGAQDAGSVVMRALDRRERDGNKPEERTRSHRVFGQSAS